MIKPLDGLLVVSLEQAVAAPTCSLRLADAGARVIKIERPEGDFARGFDRAVKGQSAYFVWLNRGKESIVLDLKTEDDRALLARMVARADVFIQNLAPGAAERLGFGSAALCARHPRLITCDISGYGEAGPYAEMKAYDLLVQAESGLAAVTGRPEGPGRVGISVCDIGAGMNAYAAVLEALLARERGDLEGGLGGGRGRGVAVSLFDALADWMSVPLLHEVYGEGAPPRVGLAHPSIAPYGVFPCADGEILIAIQNEREWHRLCAEVLGDAALAGDPRFVDNPARIANRPALDALIAEVFGRQAREDLAETLMAAGIAFGRVNGVADLAVHPQLRRITAESPGGPIELVAPAARDSARDLDPGAVPALDQHGAALRREFAA